MTGEDGKKRPLTVLERQWWAKIAAQTAQTINNIARGFDERQIDDQLNLLEMMLNKTSPANPVQADAGSEKQKESQQAQAAAKTQALALPKDPVVFVKEFFERVFGSNNDLIKKPIER